MDIKAFRAQRKAQLELNREASDPAKQFGPPPMGLPLAQFNEVARDFAARFKAERQRRPSPALYKQVGARNRTVIVTLANATFAGQLLVILADNGGYAERVTPNRLKIMYGAWHKDTVNDLIKFFQKLRTPDAPEPEEALEEMDSLHVDIETEGLEPTLEEGEVVTATESLSEGTFEPLPECDNTEKVSKPLDIQPEM